MIRKLEVLANVAVLITPVVLCSVLIKKYVLTAPSNQAAAATQRPASNAATRRGIQRGTKISLPGVDWSQSDLTLVLALSTTCRFCTDSAPLYQKLQQQRRPDVRVIAALPQSIEEAKNYLGNLGIDLPDINQFPLASIGINATPTLLLVGKGGFVKKSWVGKLPESEAATVLSEFAQPEE